MGYYLLALSMYLLNPRVGRAARFWAVILLKGTVKAHGISRVGRKVSCEAFPSIILHSCFLLNGSKGISVSSNVHYHKTSTRFYYWRLQAESKRLLNNACFSNSKTRGTVGVLSL